MLRVIGERAFPRARFNTVPWRVKSIHEPRGEWPLSHRHVALYEYSRAERIARIVAVRHQREAG